jgi:hypothetical protein
MLFVKENLEYHYTWIDGPDPATFTGNPSRRLFNRFDGHQVLFIINYFAAQISNFTIDEGRRIEQLILRQLPMNAKSEISVCTWLEEVLKHPDQNLSKKITL